MQTQEQILELPVSFRLATSDDMDFIYSTWLSYPKANSQASLTPRNLYDKEQTNKIDYLLSHNTQVMVGYVPASGEEAEILLAYMAYQYVNEFLVIHFAFTKSPFRQQGYQSYILSLVNLFNYPIILTEPPSPKVLAHIQQSHNIFYDHFYFTRQFYQDIHAN